MNNIMYAVISYLDYHEGGDYIHFVTLSKESAERWAEEASKADEYHNYSVHEVDVLIQDHDLTIPFLFDVDLASNEILETSIGEMPNDECIQINEEDGAALVLIRADTYQEALDKLNEIVESL